MLWRAGIAVDSPHLLSHDVSPLCVRLRGWFLMSAVALLAGDRLMTDGTHAPQEPMLSVRGEAVHMIDFGGSAEASRSADGALVVVPGELGGACPAPARSAVFGIGVTCPGHSGHFPFLRSGWCWRASPVEGDVGFPVVLEDCRTANLAAVQQSTCSREVLGEPFLSGVVHFAASVMISMGVYRGPTSGLVTAHSCHRVSLLPVNT